MKSERNKGRIYIMLTALGWGLAGVCVKSISWNALSLMAARSLISLLMLAAINKSLRMKLSKPNILAGFAGCITGILYIVAIKLTTAGTAIVLQYIAPILVLVYSVLFKGRKASSAEILIIAAVFGGCVLSFADNLDPTRMLGNFVAILSGVTYAGQIVLTGNSDCDSSDALMIGNVMGVIFAAPFMLFDSGLVFSTQNIIWVIILGVFQYGFANYFFSKGVHLVDAVECSVILMIEPVFNPIPVAIFCGEMMGPLAIIGAVIVITGVLVYTLLPKHEGNH